ncbi:MAG: DUF4062 domain-containing protein [Candidatus Competibacteraceae bacterium]
MHRVFLSSTARDLTAYRDAVTDAINRLDGFHCVRMEDFGARNALADDFCQTKIAECEVAVFIIGLCYGSSPKGSKESYTHREYLAAKKAGKPILVFLSAEDKFWLSGNLRCWLLADMLLIIKHIFHSLPDR